MLRGTERGWLTCLYSVQICRVCLPRAGRSWARVERKGPEASVNSYRGSSKGLTISMREIISIRYNQLEMEQRT